MDNQNVIAGAQFASETIDRLCKTGIGDEPLLFYTAMVGTHLGNIVKHIGQEATLAMMDCLREQVASIEFKEVTH